MDRRGFLKGMLVLGAAPAIVRADSLMRVIPATKGEYGLGYLISPEELLNVYPTKLIVSPNALLWPGVKDWFGKAYAVGEAARKTRETVAVKVLNEEFNRLYALHK